MCASRNIDTAGERTSYSPAVIFAVGSFVCSQVPLANTVSCSPAVSVVPLANRIYCSPVIVSDVGSLGSKGCSPAVGAVPLANRIYYWPVIVTAGARIWLFASGSPVAISIFLLVSLLDFIQINHFMKVRVYFLPGQHHT